MWTKKRKKQNRKAVDFWRCLSYFHEFSWVFLFSTAHQPEIYKGETYNLHCGTGVNISGSVFWYKDNKLIVWDDNLLSTNHKEHYTIENKTRLRLTANTEEVNGLYICKMGEKQFSYYNGKNYSLVGIIVKNHLRGSAILHR